MLKYLIESNTNNKGIILAVDDIDINLKLLEFLLTPYNFEVIKAESGKIAL